MQQKGCKTEEAVEEEGSQNGLAEESVVYINVQRGEGNGFQVR